MTYNRDSLGDDMAGPTRSTGGADLDAATLDDLRAIDPDGSEGFLSDLLQTFLDDSATHVAAIHRALQAGDHAAVKKHAHVLKGASRSIGALALGDACEQLEGAADQGRSDSVMLDLERAFEAAHRSISGVLAELA